MKPYRLEILLGLLSCTTFLLWVNQTANLLSTLIVYLIIFLILVINKMPFPYFLLVALFSIMSISVLKNIKIDAVLIVILFIYSFIKAKQKNIIIIGHLLVILFLQLSYSLISITYTFVKSDGLIGFTALLEGYMIYFIITNTLVNVNKSNFITISKIASFFMLTVTLEIIFMYYRYGFSTVINDKVLLHLGWGFSNTIAVIYVFLLPLAFYKYTCLDKRFFYRLLDLFNLIGFVLTLSRGAYVGFLIVLSFILIHRLNKRKIIPYVSVFSGFFVMFLIINKTRNIIFFIYERLSTNFLNDSHRYTLYKIAYNSFIEKVTFGNGIKSSKYLIATYSDQTNSYFHNYLLQTLATLGIVGLIIFIIFLVKLMKVFLDTKEGFIQCIALGIIGEFIHQLFDISFNKYFFGVIFYTLIALVEIYRDQNKADSYKLKRLKINKNRK